MSIEYTIDIQLTELGFPDILQPPETSTRESPSPSPGSRAAENKGRRLTRDGKEPEGASRKPSVSEKTKASSASSPPSQTLPDGEAAEPSQLTARNGVATGQESSNGPQLISGQPGEKAAEETGGEDDSDDSDVSEVYEEEEFDEEEEDEEVQTSESSQSADYQCSVCGLQLPSKFKLQDHMNLHTGVRPYGCVECGKRFCQIYNYRVHLRTHAQTKIDHLQCRVCLKGFTSQEDLNDHLSTTHLEDQFYECDLCKRVFASLKACQFHVQSHISMMNGLCDLCGRYFSSPESLARHKQKKCHRNYKCTDCNKIFIKKNALLKHSFSHLGLLPYTCVRCRCHFRLAKQYRQHKCEPERIHCVACLRDFLNQEDFQQHKKDTGCWGDQERSGTVDEIKCLECGQKFDSSEELKKHAGAHQRVLKCAECGKGFRSALLLMSHMGGHAGQSPCLCQTCGLGFPHQQNYDSHLKTCGQTSQPTSATKKRQPSRSSQLQTKKPKLNSLNAAATVTLPTAASDSPAAPATNSSSPENVEEGVSTGSCPSDGLWKLTLDKEPPPGVNLVLFVPVCSTAANGAPVSQTIQIPTMQALPESLVLKSALGEPQNTPLNVSFMVKQELEAPLDLSKKSTIPPVSIKHEPEESDISGEVNCNKANIHAGVGPIDLSASPGLLKDVKKEPLWSSNKDCKPEKEIKMEVDESSACTSSS
ncbi:uncharacterized protein KZ484_025366 isoform 2-T4 [Pholidichthys leucotaenia]